MAKLEEIYGHIKQICFKDERGIFINDEKIALDNSFPNGYIRRNGQRILSKVDGCSDVYDVSLPLKFVGAVPNANLLNLEAATIASLTCSNIDISNSEIDKGIIAKSEGISRIENFDGVAIVSVEYILNTKEIFNPKCEYDIC